MSITQADALADTKSILSRAEEIIKLLKASQTKRDREVAATASTMADPKLDWSVEYTQFYNWLLRGEVPSRLNCWESILYAATVAGILTKDALKKADDEFQATRGYSDSESLAKQFFDFKNATLLELDADGRPTNLHPGDVVFFMGTSHVALSIDDRGAVVSVWGVGSRLTTVQELYRAMCEDLSPKAQFDALIRYIRSYELHNEVIGLANDYDDYDDYNSVERDLYSFHDSWEDEEPEHAALFKTLWDHYMGALESGPNSQIRISRLG